jgi:hypothetical protein
MSFYRGSSERQTRLAPDRIQHFGDFARMGGAGKNLTGYKHCKRYLNFETTRQDTQGEF